MLTVPIVLAMTLGALRVSDQVDDAAALVGQTHYLTARDAIAALVVDMQRERYHSAVYVAGDRAGGRGGERVPPLAAFADTDKGWAEATGAIGDVTALGDGPSATYGHVVDELSQLAALRGRLADARATQAPVVIGQYTDLIGSLLTFEAALDRRLASPSSPGLPLDMTALADVGEQVAVQQVVIAAAATRGELAPLDEDTVRAADAQLANATGQLRIGAAEGHRQLLRWAESPTAQQRQQLKQTALGRAGTRGRFGIDREQWDAANGAVLADLRGTEAGVRAEIGSIGVAWSEQARDAAGITSVLLLLGLLSTAGVVYGVGRSMLGPLRLLRRTAMEVANRRLPEAVRAMRKGRAPAVTVKPVGVTSTEEIGQVARAFDAVHGQAVRLAAEQATLQTNVSGMFVNLSRRTQTLVERQLRLIERLERNEQDSEQLDNLFKLDHLATRMRRNSENLLILAGSKVTNRPNQAVPVADVLRAAASEIEQYQRVVVRTSVEAQVVGLAAKDLMHLVAELLDNATNFSGPDTQVLVDSIRTTDGSVLFEIADKGVGMTEEELSAANRRLSGTVEMDVSTSRRMGLFVVGRLAARHQIKVRLASTEQSRGSQAGITAFVHVFPHLITASTTDDGRASKATAARRLPTWPEPARSPRVPLNGRATNGKTNGNGNPTRIPTRHPETASANGSATPAQPHHDPHRSENNHRTSAHRVPPASESRTVEPRRQTNGHRPSETSANGTDPLTDDWPLTRYHSASESSAHGPEADKTPIYTGMESTWFRSDGDDGAPERPPDDPGSTRQGAGAAGREPAGKAPPGTANPGGAETPATDAAAEQRSRGRDASEPLHPMPEAAQPPPTTSGLPKRTPQAQVIPRGGEAGESGEAPRRSPERTRGMLASYQEGLRQGRTGSDAPWRNTPMNVPFRTGGEQS
ncbi:MAG: nitrate- and nitrite sensing domain-containing protein [Pseudonocardia sp.]|nr:nitrate- and nitrite sensing domain-containing protein [Pseudonocardia sp.]